MELFRSAAPSAIHWNVRTRATGSEVQAMDRAEDRLAHPAIRVDDWPYPRSVIADTDAFVCRDLAGLRGRTDNVMRFLWNGNGTAPAPLGP